KAESSATNVVILNDQGGSVMNIEKDGVAGTPRSQTHGHEQIIAYASAGYGNRVESDVMSTITTENCNHVRGDTPLVQSVAIAENVIGRRMENGGNGIGAQEELAYTQNATGVMGVAYQSVVRRLTPLECERLMGFPDNHTKIPWNNKTAKDCPDAPRYKACGNSMCVNVMEWIGRRIEKVEKMKGF
ncbi:MAG: DNA cytosine methyltransferase, partial [Ruthenibacterium sp.]